MVKVLLLVKPKNEELQQLQKEFQGVTFSTDLQAARDAEVILGWNSKLSQTILENKKLRWIQAKSAGVDYFPLKELKNRGIILTTASGIHSRYIAETVGAYILIENRGLRPIIKNPGKWIEPQVLETTEQTVFIFGTGHIGTEIARYCKFFGMKVIGVNRHGADKKLMDIFDEVITMNQFKEQSNEVKADYVINILPGTAATRHFFDKERLKKFTPDYTFINVGRGSSVVTADLQKLLADHYLRSAYLDVFEKEPLPVSSSLWHSQEVVGTPHISGLIPHFNAALYPLFSENLRHYFAEEPLHNTIDYGKEY
ncbi:NAD(P)-dependent oxidoreductase [Liquorilactobacillus oeni]|nr:NAD(P)-dependent oxidoreductase [Liquorilactobacillus oeni]